MIKVECVKIYGHMINSVPLWIMHRPVRYEMDARLLSNSLC